LYPASFHERLSQFAGCDTSRLRDFVVGFYSHHSASHQQTIDGAFYTFVWSVILQQPTVRVGTVPDGAATEVYIAPQSSAKRKAKAKGEPSIEEVTPVLDIVPDARARTLDDLKTQYGNKLRIAVDPKTSFAAITGSHIRVGASSLRIQDETNLGAAAKIESHGVHCSSVRHSR